MTDGTPPRIARPRGHDGVLARLWSAARADRLPHALCFEGPAGIGKFPAALWFAAGLLCERGPGEPCGACGPCARAVSWNHPDLFVVDVVSLGFEVLRIGRMVERPPEKVHKDDRGAIPVERFLGHVAAEGGWRVVVVRETDRANREASNSILKLLEEPGRQALWILETARPEALLETVRSRCVSVPFQAPPLDVAVDVLVEKGVDAAAARELARWAEGSVGTALELERSGAAAALEHVAAVAAGRSRPFAAAADVWQLDGEYPGATPTARNRARARAVLDLCAAVARDQARADRGVDADRLPHGARTRTGGPDAARRRAVARDVVTEILAARAAVDANVTPDGVVDRAFLALARLAPAAARQRDARGLG